MSLKNQGSRRTGRGIHAERALTIANTHCLWTYGMNLCAGQPRRLSLPEGKRSIVSIMYSPGVGPVGEVGLVAVDARTGEVLGCTPRAEVLEGARKLALEKREEIQPPFVRQERSDTCAIACLRMHRE